jgi:hypothetical protein
METNSRTRILSVIAAVAFALTTMRLGYRTIGLPPVVIVGGSSVIALVMWNKYYTGFGPAMSRLFDISWTERSFLIVFAFVGPALYSLTALGLFYRVPFAGFLAWFIFIGPGVAEFTHFIFPLLQPAIRPELPGTISQAVSNGRFVADMRNYYIGTTGRYYFPGMYTAVLPMIPGIWAIVRMVRAGAGRSP